ncbi:EthD domain-containing protein [Prescottella subtropica]|uniref:EthD domain-containing protein n=1 Tax=Prescottella subtropica TaxID=2545757 RepID=UPI0010F629EF|nr:EthD domain-containing protein [Prescottella subtropica]
MITAVALLARRPDLSHEQFVDYYENNHAKLIRSLLPQIRGYRRNYLDHGSRIGAADAPGFDVISEFVFDDRAAYDDMPATHARPEVKAVIEADEENFLDRARTRMYLVDTRQS